MIFYEHAMKSARYVCIKPDHVSIFSDVISYDCLKSICIHVNDLLIGKIILPKSEDVQAPLVLIILTDYENCGNIIKKINKSCQF